MTRHLHAVDTRDLGDVASLAVGIDVGGSKTSLVVTDAADRLLWRDVQATDAADLGEQIVALAAAAVDRCAALGDQPVGIGVAVPGQVDALDGTLRLAVNLRAPVLALGPIVAERIGLACAVEHDARAAAMWLAQRRDRPARHLAYVSIGTGISAGIVVDGQVVRGAVGLAGEIGHVAAIEDGPLCPCGLHGCLEAVAAGPAIVGMTRAALAGGRASVLTADATPADVFAAAAAGDELAAAIATTVTGYLARAIRGLVLGFGVDRVVIGGGVAAAGDILLESVERHIDAERRASPLIEAAFGAATIEMLAPDAEAVARGAAYLARARARAGQAVGEGVGNP